MGTFGLVWFNVVEVGEIFHGVWHDRNNDVVAAGGSSVFRLMYLSEDVKGSAAFCGCTVEYRIHE